METVYLEETQQMKAEDISTFEEVRIWAVERDAWRDQQSKETVKAEIKMAALETELRTLKSKFVWANGAVTVITSFCGAALAITLAFWKMQS